MHHNKKGQALVEFVIILPIFIFMIFVSIDIGKILYYQNNLESRMDEFITSYEVGKTKKEIEENYDLKEENIILTIDNEKEHAKFTLKKEVSVITPGLNYILGNPHTITVKRVMYHE